MGWEWEKQGIDKESRIMGKVRAPRGREGDEKGLLESLVLFEWLYYRSTPRNRQAASTTQASRLPLENANPALKAFIKLITPMRPAHHSSSTESLSFILLMVKICPLWMWPESKLPRHCWDGSSTRRRSQKDLALNEGSRVAGFRMKGPILTCREELLPNTRTWNVILNAKRLFTPLMILNIITTLVII